MISLKEQVSKVRSGETQAEAVVKEALNQIGKTQHLKAYLSVLPEYALEKARALDGRREKGEALGPLAGVPIAIKDNIVVSSGKTTCASRILENFQSPYDATVVERLLAAGAIPVGKTNLDEFAMGATSETSAFGAPINPLDPTVIPGGSSGGSAVAVASGSVPVSLGSDTGGSIRQPAACCGIVGMKPTYGRVSRYGLVAYASSLDQIGPFAHTVADAALLLNVIAGHDKHDNTSSTQEVPDFTAGIGKGLKGKSIGIPKECFGEGLDPEVESVIRAALAACEREGAKIVEVSLPSLKYAVATYYVIATAEASANLSRYDGVRYTTRTQSPKNLYELYAKTRSEGFGAEVKKRILLGTYVLSSGFYDAYYMQAQKVRRVITDDYANAFKQCDVVAMPTLATPTPKVGKVFQDPMAMYLQDIYTVAVNLAGLPGLSLPAGKVAGLPTGLQLIGRPFAEQELFQVSDAVEKLVAM
ncbi:MAG TPA: Asp-tRNA(Asn)/Glu-tRNA(Gln) amidotransferase GatCAB subunit A [Fibrobacteres bacterium]|jgi:aspartyl-tRNA(Asn)/glutamyl-tRNA(Gln) amidotransferase subunit A|nr:Asp-tRNA(Asn)/Glu-tRNA(Gln) amidotransferase GatCAB subunit A [Fibrobacterota bacterium]